MDTKILMYAHDGVGLGHISRMANIADCLTRYNKNILIQFISGYDQLYHFINDKVDFIKLPYSNKVLCKDQKPSTRLILTMRGVVFSEASTYSFYKGRKGINFINKNYDKVVCFCDPRIIDVNKDYFNNTLKIPVLYPGYIHYPMEKRKEHKRGGRKLLVNFGGSYKCELLLQKLLCQLTCENRKDIEIHIIIGEYFEWEVARQLQEQYPQFIFHPSMAKKELMDLYVDIIVGCGGYNVMIDAIFNGIPLIILPKRHTDEARIHSLLLQKYASITVLEEVDFPLLWVAIDKQLSTVPTHCLKMCTDRDIKHILN